jgi:hypothetical protein
VKPVTVGALIILYGGLSLTAIVIGGFTIGLLEAMPLVVLAGVAALGVLELPVVTMQPGSAIEPIDRALVAVRTKTGLMIAALLLTGVAMVLLLVRLVPSGDFIFRLSLIGREPADAQWLLGLLVAGVAMVGGIAIALARHGRAA